MEARASGIVGFGARPLAPNCATCAGTLPSNLSGGIERGPGRSATSSIRVIRSVQSVPSPWPILRRVGVVRQPRRSHFGPWVRHAISRNAQCLKPVDQPDEIARARPHHVRGRRLFTGHGEADDAQLGRCKIRRLQSEIPRRRDVSRGFTPLNSCLFRDRTIVASTTKERPWISGSHYVCCWRYVSHTSRALPLFFEVHRYLYRRSRETT